MKLDEVIRVPSMEECRRSVRDGEPQPTKSAFIGNPGYSIALTRWNRAYMELCPHPLEDRTVGRSFIGTPMPECRRCNGRVPEAQWTEAERSVRGEYLEAWGEDDD